VKGWAVGMAAVKLGIAPAMALRKAA
jgi:hypothetical protein